MSIVPQNPPTYLFSHLYIFPFFFSKNITCGKMHYIHTPYTTQYSRWCVIF